MLEKNMILEKECANLEAQLFENRKKMIVNNFIYFVLKGNSYSL